MRADSDAGSPRRAIRVGRVFVALVWIAALGFFGLVVARFVAYDRTETLALLNAQTVWVFLPAYALASAGFLFRRYALGIVATVVVVFHLSTVIASIGAPQAVTAEARAAPHLRLLSANVRYTNPEPERLARELMEVDADVVLLQEITPEWVVVLDEAGFRDRYRYAAKEPRNDSGGQAVYSRLPLSGVNITYRAYWPTISASIEVDGVRVALVDVHSAGPPEGIDRHDATVDGLVEMARTLSEPRILAGDFNASPYNRTVHRIVDLGLESAHEQRGRGLATTWPNGKRPVPPTRLDHVFVDDTIVVLAVRELVGSGSDHKPIVADLAIT